MAFPMLSQNSMMAQKTRKLGGSLGSTITSTAGYGHLSFGLLEFYVNRNVQLSQDPWNPNPQKHTI